MKLPTYLLVPISLDTAKAVLVVNSEAEAIRNLETQCRELVKMARWSPYCGKINELRIPLAQLRLARRKGKKS